MKKFLVFSALVVLSLVALILLQREHPRTDHRNANLPIKRTPALAETHANPTPAPISEMELWRIDAQNAKSSEFKSWAERFVSATAADKETLIAEGVTLATARRSEMASLIRNNPEQALEEAVPQTVREAMPPVISDRGPAIEKSGAG